MHIQILLPLISLFAGLTYAQLNYCEGNKATIGYCTATSFRDVTASTTSPPTVSECMEACRVGVLGDLGDWGVTITPNSGKKMMVGFPCAFSVGAAKPTDNFSFSMHNQDIVDIMDEVNKRFGGLHRGRVAATGTMICEGHEAVWYVD